MKQALEAYCKTLNPLWNTGISRTEAEGFFEAGFKASVAEAEKQEPVELAPIYFMRDDHTFKRLSDDVSTALIEIEHEFNEGWTYGSLCSKREGFSTIHANGSAKRLYFFHECQRALEAAHGIKEKNS